MNRVDTRNTLRKPRPDSSTSASGWSSSSNPSSFDAQPTSRTMQFATESISEANRPRARPSWSSTAVLDSPSTSYRRFSAHTALVRHKDDQALCSTAGQRVQDIPPFGKPSADLDTGDWRYWAARSLRAETMLADRSEGDHYQDDYSSQNFTRVRTTARELEIHARQLQLKRYERIIWVLALSLAFLIGFVFYHSLYSRSQSKSKTWHFTIPILSPFTSVVENESSVIGSKTIAFGGSILATLAYFMFRYWLSYRHKPS